MTGGIVAIIIVLIVIGAITASTIAYFRLQGHRADAVAMAGYRKLAEQAVVEQEDLNKKLGELNGRLSAIESLLRSVE